MKALVLLAVFVSADIDSRVRIAWEKLGETRNACPKEYDYFPEGGMRIFACHAKTRLRYKALHSAAKMQVWLSGPHNNEKLVLDAAQQFGHYNPQFVDWMVDRFVPGEKDAAFREATQTTYDTYIKPLARLFYITYRKAKKNRECFTREVKRVEDLLAAKKLPEADYERYFYFMNREFCQQVDNGDYLFDHGFDGGHNGNVVKTCVAFWIRRTIDGTADEFYRGLEKLLRTYDATVLQQQQQRKL